MPHRKGILEIFNMPFLWGIASFPEAEYYRYPGYKFVRQGIILNYMALPDQPSNVSGRTLVHEVGHFLGLWHIWGADLDSIGSIDACLYDDGIFDTPDSGVPNYICDTSLNTCVDSGIDLPDMIENYMDYTGEPCRIMFTQGQVNVMRNVLEKYRPALRFIEPEPEPPMPQAASKPFVLHPNPAGDNIKIIADTVLSITLMDMQGRVLSTVQNAKEADVSRLKPGVYIATIKLEDAVKTQMFVKE
jgi:hypothetical protein